jgi:hypothetical protein
VYTDPEHPEIVCERYRFCFGYGKDRHQSVDMYHNDTKFARAYTKDEVCMMS